MRIGKIASSAEYRMDKQFQIFLKKKDELYDNFIFALFKKIFRNYLNTQNL